MKPTVSEVVEAMLVAVDASLVLRKLTDAELIASGGGNSLRLACISLDLDYEAVEATARPVLGEVVAEFRQMDIPLRYPYGDGCIDGAVEAFLEAAYRLQERNLS